MKTRRDHQREAENNNANQAPSERAPKKRKVEGLDEISYNATHQEPQDDWARAGLVSEKRNHGRHSPIPPGTPPPKGGRRRSEPNREARDATTQRIASQSRRTQPATEPATAAARRAIPDGPIIVHDDYASDDTGLDRLVTPPPLSSPVDPAVSQGDIGIAVSEALDHKQAALHDAAMTDSTSSTEVAQRQPGKDQNSSLSALQARARDLFSKASPSERYSAGLTKIHLQEDIAAETKLTQEVLTLVSRDARFEDSIYLETLDLYRKGLKHIALQRPRAREASPEPEQAPHRNALSTCLKVEGLQDAEALKTVLEQVQGWMNATKTAKAECKEAKREAVRAAKNGSAEGENDANIDLLTSKLAGLEIAANLAQGIISMSKPQLKNITDKPENEPQGEPETG